VAAVVVEWIWSGSHSFVSIGRKTEILPRRENITRNHFETKSTAKNEVMYKVPSGKQAQLD